MQSPEIVQQIKQQVQAGIPRTDIIETFTQQGLKLDDILSIFKTVDSTNPMPVTTTSTNSESQQTISDTISFSIGSAVAAGWHLVWKNIGFVLVTWILYIIFNALIYVVSLQLVATLNQTIIIGSGILFQLFNAYISIGIISITLKYIDGLPVSLIDLFPPVLVFVRFVSTWLLSWLITAGGTLMGIIPGIYWGVQFSFGGYYVLDKQASPIQALKASIILTHKEKWKLMLFQLVSAGIVLLGALCLLLGILVALPITLLALAAIYRRLEVEKNPTQHLAETTLFTIPRIIALVIGGMVGCLFIVMWLFPQIDYIVLLNIMYPKKTNAILYVNPKTIQLSNQTTPGKQIYSFENLSFQLPWNESVQIKDVQAKTATDEIIKSASGKQLSIVSWGQDDVVNTFSQADTTQSPALQTQLKNIYSPTMLSSAFNFYSTLYATSPDQLTLQSSYKDAQKTFVLTTLKKTQLVATNTTEVYYAFSTTNLQGFVYPRKNNLAGIAYTVEAWDKANNRYTFLFADPALSIQDINTFLSTLVLHPAASSSSSPTNNRGLPTPQTSPLPQISATVPISPTIPITHTIIQPTSVPTLPSVTHAFSATVENNVTVSLSNIHSDSSGIYLTATFTNNSSVSQDVNPGLHIQSGNLNAFTHPYPAPPGTEPNQTMFTSVPLSPGQTTTLSMSSLTVPLPVTIFYHKLDNTEKMIGTYSGQ